MKKIKSILFIIFLLSFNLSAAGYSDGSWNYKLPDEIGNLLKTEEKTDRKYGKAGQLLKDETYSYSYDEVGNLIEKESITGTWKYRWSQGGMLKQVVRPDNKKVDFTYDALGRRLTKTYNGQTTHFVWDGNVPLHEWTSSVDETISTVNENGETEISIPENLTTWVFEDGTFIPQAKLQGDKSYSIITDHLGTPTEAYDEEGQKVWSRELGIYGQSLKESGVENFIPFKYQGQYEDVETGLCYNRYRYYDANAGSFISQDPIGLDGGMPNMYSYTTDSNTVVDPFGLKELYALLASKDGWYPVMEYGKKNPVGEMFLKKGDLWKIGETKNPARRYTQKWLKKMNLDKVAIANGPKKLMQALEKMKLKGYKAWKGFLPPGNKACH